MSYRYLENISTGDAAFMAESNNLEELFEDAAIATFEVMVDTRSIDIGLTLEIELKNESIDGLMMDWLSELIYLKDTEEILIGKFDVTIRKNDNYLLKAKVSGENMDQKKHKLRSDVKAVTFHYFEVKKTGENWTARVVLDI
ncbi:MAG: archease [Candidatus Methanoperedens sp.]|nr:archease [Candidatus Methanoperedens sp.]MCE8424901.1 archease [Candidatus Methanoperedens sp.]MCE8428109.1 archease [Candidatus Methanoperedens sp.]